jgi:cytochrome c553
MMLGRVVLKIGVLGALALGPWVVQAADVAAGREKAQRACVACHGADGHTTASPSYPKLAGQHRDYLQVALRDYQTGARKNAIMASQVQGLSRKDLADLAAYFASLPSSLRVEP